MLRFRSIIAVLACFCALCAGVQADDDVERGSARISSAADAGLEPTADQEACFGWAWAIGRRVWIRRELDRQYAAYLMWRRYQVPPPVYPYPVYPAYPPPAYPVYPQPAQPQPYPPPAGVPQAMREIACPSCGVVHKAHDP